MSGANTDAALADLGRLDVGQASPHQFTRAAAVVEDAAVQILRRTGPQRWGALVADLSARSHLRPGEISALLHGHVTTRVSPRPGARLRLVDVRDGRVIEAVTPADRPTSGAHPATDHAEAP